MIDRHVPAQSQAAFHSEFDGAMNYSQDMLRQMMSITESFANRAAACFLMPRFLVMRMLKQYNAGNKVIAYDGYVMSQDQKDLIQRIADAMGVNYSPMFNRLKELDLIDVKPIEEYLSRFRMEGGER